MGPSAHLILVTECLSLQNRQPETSLAIAIKSSHKTLIFFLFLCLVFKNIIVVKVF